MNDHRSQSQTTYQPLRGFAGVRRNASLSVTSWLDGRPFRGAHRLRHIVSRLVVPSLRAPTRVATKHGFNIGIDPAVMSHECIERSVYFHGGYEEGTLDVLQRVLKPGDTFIDVGGNIGLMALAASRRVGAKGVVYAFEPNPAVLPSLRRNIALNDAANIHVVERALGSAPGRATIYPYTEVSIGSASLIAPEEQSTSGTEVDVVTLDDFIADAGVGPVNLIKADVEGWEFEVFRGAATLLSQDDAPALCFEYSRTHGVEGGTWEDLYRFILEINDYRIYKLAKGKEIPSPLVEITSVDQLPAHDNLFAFLPRHLDDPESLTTG